MEKEFIIRGISAGPNNEWYHMEIQDVKDTDDVRFLHINPYGAVGAQAGGIEMTHQWFTKPGVGYLLKEKESKPVRQWQAGDIIIEQYYPAEFDNG